MRLPVLVLCSVLLPAGLLPAQSVAVRFTFDTARAPAGEPGAVLEQRRQLRAWQDTVEIYLVQQAPSAGLRVASPQSAANYMASIVASPVARPGVNGVTLAVVIFEPGTATPWRYLTHFTAYAESAREAAGSLIGQTVAAVSTPAR